VKNVLRIGGVLALLLTLGGCESRDRTNPFDPRNPDTNGEPELLDARAGNREVTLYWDAIDLDGIREANLYRREGPDGAETRLTPGGITLAAGSFTDTTVQNGVDYEYRLDLSLSSGDGRSSAWDAATPGRAIPWVADADGGGLLRLTPDGRDLVRRVDAGLWFLDLAADTSTATIWAAEYFDGSLSRYDAAGGRQLVLPSDGARTVAVSSDGADIWVASFRDGRIDRRDVNGTLLWHDITGSHTEDLLVSTDGGLWAAGWFESGAGEVRLYLHDQLVRQYEDLQRPVALAEASRERIVVVDRADRRVRSYDPLGVETSRSGQIFLDPVDVCPDGTGGVWVADPGRGGIVRLNRDLAEDLFVSLPQVLGITLDPVGGRIWTAGPRGVSALNLSGRVLSTVALGGRPVKVELLYTPEIR
jgi:streptogramin lyase